MKKIILIFITLLLSGCVANKAVEQNTNTSKIDSESTQPINEILIHNPYLHTISFFYNPTNFQEGASWENKYITAEFNRAYDIININCKDERKITCVRLDRTVAPEDENYYPRQMSDNWCQVHLESSNNSANENDVYSVRCE